MVSAHSAKLKKYQPVSYIIWSELLLTMSVVLSYGLYGQQLMPISKEMYINKGSTISQNVFFYFPFLGIVELNQLDRLYNVLVNRLGMRPFLALYLGTYN